MFPSPSRLSPGWNSSSAYRSTLQSRTGLLMQQALYPTLRLAISVGTPEDKARHSTALPGSTMDLTVTCKSTQTRNVSGGSAGEETPGVLDGQKSGFFESIFDLDVVPEPQPSARNLIDLMSLPTEMHLEVMDFLDHPNLLRFAATNKYFRSLVSRRKLKDSLRRYEYSSAVTKPLLTEKKSSPCYTCLKGLDLQDHFLASSRDRFFASSREEKWVSSKEHGSARICVNCIIHTRHESTPELQVYPTIPTRARSSKQRAIVSQGYLFDDNTDDSRKPRLFASKQTSPFSPPYFLPWRVRDWWIKCPKCKLVKRYRGDPFGARQRYDDALFKGEMCAACYQPVWAEEDRGRRAKRNAKNRQRYQAKKEEAHKWREESRQQEMKPAELATPLSASQFLDFQFASADVTSFMPYSDLSWTGYGQEATWGSDLTTSQHTFPSFATLQ